VQFAVVVPWHNVKQRASFLTAWGLPVIGILPDWLFLTQDTDKSGCAVTKNRGIRAAYDAGAEVIVVLDDDCYPPTGPIVVPGPVKGMVVGGPTTGYTLQTLAEDHIKSLEPQRVYMVVPTTRPCPRGMPYRNRHITMPVAASIGFWLKNPDFDAMTSLVLGPETEVSFAQMPFFRHYFPFSGMNFAFRREWIDCAELIDVARFDDIWMGWIWEKIAFEKGYCFNLAGPVVTHARQSNVWQNLRDEVKYLEVNETLWSAAHSAPTGLTASQLRDLLFGAVLPEKVPEPVVLPLAPS
jgi:hypothetical protein